MDALKVTCMIVVFDSGSIRVAFQGPVNGKTGQLALLMQAMEIVRQGDG
jgi:hypothetical protein